MKELFIEAQEEMIEELFLANPAITDEEAYAQVNSTVGCAEAMNRVTDKLADIADQRKDSQDELA